MEHTNTFSFNFLHKGTRYVYDSENEVLYTNDGLGQGTEQRSMNRKTAVKLLMDSLYDTVKPIHEYSVYGRSNLGECHRCGLRV